MAEFSAKCEFFAKKYGMWFSDQHKQDACVTFDIFSFGRTDLCYSELFLKAISRAMKSASKVKIGQIVQSYGAFPQAIAALGISRLCCLL